MRKFAIIASLIAFAATLFFVRPASAGISGEFINPVAGSPVTVPAGQWFAGEEFWVAPSGSAQRITIGSNITTSATEFNYTVDNGYYNGTRAVYANDERDARVRAILLAEGEKENAGLYKSPEVWLGQTQLYPSDNRLLNLFVPMEITSGQETTIQVYAPEFVQLTLDFGDGAPPMIIGPEHGLLDGIVNVPHVYNVGNYTITATDNRGGRSVTQTANVVADEQPTPTTGTLQILSGATATGNKQYTAPRGALLTFEASASVAGTYCFYWTLDGSDKFCPDITADGGKVTGQKIFQQNVTEAFVKLMTLDGTTMLDQVYIKFTSANPDPQPSQGMPVFKNVQNPAAQAYGAIVSFDICAVNGPFEGVVNFGDSSDSGLLGLASGQCVRLEHVFENTAGKDKVFTVAAIRQGETMPSATLELTIKPERYFAFLPLVRKAFIAPVITPTTVSAAGQPVTIKVTAGTATQIWIDYGNDRHNGGQMFADNQSREYTIFYEGDTWQDVNYQVVLSYKDEKGQVKTLPTIVVTTTFRR